MNARRFLIQVAFGFVMLFLLSGQACPADGESGLPAPGPQGPPGEDASVTGGTGVTVENGVVSLDTAFTDSLYWKLDATPTGADLLATAPNQALELHVNGVRAMRMEPTVSCPNLIGGLSNAVADGITAATISGGGPTIAQDATTGNRVTDDFGTIGGGGNNRAGDDDGSSETGTFATVSGGRDNAARGNSTTIGGGELNVASGTLAAIGGGSSNTAAGLGSFVGGGADNVAEGTRATIAGGAENSATGSRSVVGGGSGNSAGGSWSTLAGGSDNSANGEHGTVGGGDSNVASGQFASIGGGDENIASGERATIGGGGRNVASGASASVGGGSDNVANGSRATVAGGLFNNASAFAATVGGGGGLDETDASTGNRATDEHCTVAGGGDNQAGDADGSPISARFATVSGGSGNSATDSYSTVGGGERNSADGPRTTIGGGQINTANGYAATIGGGYSNQTTGLYATIPGGLLNEAVGSASFAAGNRAKANHLGSFVWADSTNADVESYGDDTFSVRATGGARFYSSDNLGTGVELPTGGGAWSTLSDRNRKENIRQVDGRDVLERLVRTPIGSWNYKSQEDAIRHMGPMAQDFYKAFGLGESDKRISTIDADGVALAAIQGLHEMVKERDEQITELREALKALQARVEVLEAK